MSTLWIEVGGVDYSAYIQKDGCTAKRAGPGVVGGADVTLVKAGGGLTAIQPLAPVKLARLDGAGHFERRLIYGVVAVAGLYQEIGTNVAYYDLKCTDSNIVGRAVRVPVGVTIHLAGADFDDQIADLVAQVQDAYGGTWEALDTTQVPNLHSSMPAADLEGGHDLDWYLANREQVVRDATANAVDPARYWSVDDTAGPVTFGLITLQYYDRLGSAVSVLALADTNHTLRSWKRTIDAATYYGRRQGVGPFGGSSNGTVEGVAASPLVNPWQGGGWVAPPLKLDTTDADVAQAWIDTDILSNGALRQTIRGIVRQLTAQAGDTVDWTLALAGLAADQQRVVDTSADFLAASADVVEMELTTGTIPRRLGESGRTVAGGVVLRDVIAPDPPTAAPTIVSDVFNPVRRQAEIVARSVSSVSADVTALRLRYVVNGGVENWTVWTPVTGPDPVTVDFPLIGVAPAAAVVLDVQARDGAGNESGYGPDFTETADGFDDPLAPTAATITSGIERFGSIAFMKSTLTLPTPNTAAWWICSYRVHTTGPWREAPRIPATETVYSLSGLRPNTRYDFWFYGETAYGDRSSTPLQKNNILIAPLITPSPPPINGFHPDNLDVTGADGWTTTQSGILVSAAQSTTVVYESVATFKFAVSSGGGSGQSCTLTSEPVVCAPGVPFGLHVRAGDASNTNGTLLLQVEWRDKTDAALSTTNLYNAAPSTTAGGVAYAAQLMPPASATQYAVIYRFTTNGVANAVYVGAPVVERAKGTVDTYFVTSGTDPIWIYETSGEKGGKVYSDGTQVRISGVTVGGADRGVRLDSTDGHVLQLYPGQPIDITAAGGQGVNIAGDTVGMGASAGDVTITATGDVALSGTNLLGNTYPILLLVPPTDEIADFVMAPTDPSGRTRRCDTTGLLGANIQAELPLISAVPDGWTVAVTLAAQGIYGVDVVIAAHSGDLLVLSSGTAPSYSLSLAGQRIEVEADAPRSQWLVRAVYV